MPTTNTHYHITNRRISQMKNLTSSTLHCKCCGKKMPLPRKRGQRREFGHIKHLWCWGCKEVTAHVEQREGDYIENIDLLLKGELA